MDYLKIYDNLIETRKKRKTKSEFYEKHHIIPKCLGGSDDKSNLVNLTPREHFVAHLLLAKIYGGSLIFALKMMCSSRYGRINNRIYESLKQKIKEQHSISCLEKWAKKKGFSSYQEQCESFWKMFKSGMRMYEICKIYSATEKTISASIKKYISENNLEDEYKAILFSRKSEHAKNVRLNESDESKRKRNQKNVEAGWRGPKQKTLGENPSAVKIKIDDTIYDSIKEASILTGISYPTICYRLKIGFSGYSRI